MGIQKTWHEYLAFDSREEYNVDHKDQHFTKARAKTEADSFKKAKNNYKVSEKLYSSAKLDSELLSMVINDPGHRVFSDTTKKLILQSKLRSLKPLMVNASSASRKAELKGYEEDAEKYTKKLDIINSRNPAHQHKQSKTKETSHTSSPKKTTEEWFKTTNKFLHDLFTLNPIQFVRWVGELNLYRLSFRFSQISWKNIWTYLQSLGILDATSKMRGFFINIPIMDYPAPTFNALSVLIFALKLSINATLPLKHLFAPTSRVELAFGWWTRAKIEIERVWDIYANDIFWMIFNGITNFPLLIGLAIPVANWILVGALFFDVAVLSVLLYKEEKKLNAEIAWLSSQISVAQTNKTLLNNPSEEGAQQNNKEQLENIDAHLEMYEAMQKQARIIKISNRAALIACIIATAMFITSLTLILSLASPLMAPIGFFACVLAVAVILSRKDIASYASAKASQHIFKDQASTKDIRAENARKTGLQLVKSLAEFIFIPMIIIGLYTINWPAAVAFTAIYICVKASGVKLTSSERNYKPKSLEFEDESLGSTISPMHI